MTKLVNIRSGHMDTAAALRHDSNAARRPPTAGRPRSTALVDPWSTPSGHLDLLESLAIFIIREVAAESERPVLLFSGGKDSAVLLHLAAKAFKPGRIPFPVLHVDTGHNFPEVLDYRDAQVEAEGARLLVASVQDSIDQGRVADPGPAASRNRLQTTTLLDAIKANTASTPPSAGPAATRTRRGPRSGCCRSATPSGSGTPSANAPSCGSSTRAACGRASTSAPSLCRTGPSSTSGSTSAASASSCPSIYYAHTRQVVERDGMLLAVSEWVSPERRAGRARRPRALPHRGRRHAAPAPCARTRRPWRTSSARCRPPGSPNGARPGLTTGSPRPPWRTASARVTSRP